MTLFHIPVAQERIAGRYRLDTLIAEGGFASVWAAVREDDGTKVAIKFILPNKVDDPKVVERFRREAKLLSKLSHPNIVAVLDFGVTEPLDTDKYEGVPFLVMEHLDGTTLETVMRESKGPVSIRRAVELVTPVLNALEEAHRYGVIHRDLKPENIFVEKNDGEESPRLIDFGICKRLDSSPFNTGSEGLTATDQVFGTPEYMSPEQIAADPISPSTDIYSVGVILYELLTGRRPFEGATPLKVMLKHLDVPMPSLPMPYADLAIAGIVRRATEKDPAARFESAAEMRDALLDLPDDVIMTDPAELDWVSRLSQAQTEDLRPPTAVTKPATRNPDSDLRLQGWAVIAIAIIAAVAVLATLVFVFSG